MTTTVRNVPTTDNRRTRDTILHAEGTEGAMDLGWTTADIDYMTEESFDKLGKAVDSRRNRKKAVNDHRDPNIRLTAEINARNAEFWEEQRKSQAW